MTARGEDSYPNETIPNCFVCESEDVQEIDTGGRMVWVCSRHRRVVERVRDTGEAASEDGFVLAPMHQVRLSAEQAERVRRTGERIAGDNPDKAEQLLMIVEKMTEHVGDGVPEEMLASIEQALADIGDPPAYSPIV